MRTAFHKQFIDSLFKFIDTAPTPFHATKNIVLALKEAGFSELKEAESWSLEAHGRYYVTRNDSSIIAWQQGAKPFEEVGVNMLGAHTDSPCLRVRPNPELRDHDVVRVAVDTYGGVLLNPWFDRDLSLAGRVHYQAGGALKSCLIDLKCPIGLLPSLAIHLDREANSKRAINPQLHTPIYVATQGADLDVENAEAEEEGRQLLSSIAAQVVAQDPEFEKILDFELSFYDVQGAAIVGLRGDFIASARLDNLLSCFIDLQALLGSLDQGHFNMIVCSDHEEVGSRSNAGAAGPFLKQVLERVAGNHEALSRGLSQSMLVSTDNAHALHANHPAKMEPMHSPKLNQGPVIKVNVNQSYASNSETQAMFRAICQRHDIPHQEFVTRGDMGCGSTIGPITSAEIGIKTLDVGAPTLGMHSIRETAGYDDALYLYEALKQFLLRT